MVALSDVLSKIRNAEEAGKREVVIRPLSKVVKRILEILGELDYAKEVEINDNKKGGEAIITLRGKINDIGEISPNFPVKVQDLRKFEKRYLPAHGFGVLILTSPEGIITNEKAQEMNTGGKLLAYVY